MLNNNDDGNMLMFVAWGCCSADVTAAGCAECFNHKEAFENVCVW